MWHLSLLLLYISSISNFICWVFSCYCTGLRNRILPCVECWPAGIDSKTETGVALRSRCPETISSQKSHPSQFYFFLSSNFFPFAAIIFSTQWIMQHRSSSHGLFWGLLTMSFKQPLAEQLHLMWSSMKYAATKCFWLEYWLARDPIFGFFLVRPLAWFCSPLLNMFISSCFMSE